MTKRRLRGVTLIEVLIVIAIISLLVQLALPAMQSARESARQTQCKNNVRQLALGCQLHANTHRHYPTGGWTSHFMGDPNRDYGKAQPGGWGYNVLPFIEEQDLHDLGAGLPETERRKVAAHVYGTAVPLFICTSRHSIGPQPFIRNELMKNADVDELKRLAQAGRSDYAGNMGNKLPVAQFFLGPKSYEQGDEWKEGGNVHKSWVASNNNGVIYQRSEVTPAMVTDGISKTFLLGEKFIPTGGRKITTQGDDQSLYVGFSHDNNRGCNGKAPPTADSSVAEVNKREGRLYLWRFGGAHPAGFHMAYCDGSVHKLDYGIDAKVFAAMSTRDRGDSTEQFDPSLAAN